MTTGTLAQIFQNANSRSGGVQGVLITVLIKGNLVLARGPASRVAIPSNGLMFSGGEPKDGQFLISCWHCDNCHCSLWKNRPDADAVMASNHVRPD
ncbi:MAG: hypothetical protein HY674_02655 [Chloroflexi bacterium]|nr:hypothetical protein [Chloroflexota bacterium]